MTNLNKKTAIVTGGTRGIGRAISLKLGSIGYRVIALYARNREAAESIENEAKSLNIELATFRGDLTKEDCFNEIVDYIKTNTKEIDVLIHSAASGVHKSPFETTEKHLKWTYDINVFSFHKLLQTLLPRIAREGSIIGITSLGSQAPLLNYSAVGSSKAAMESLFRYYAKQLAMNQIAVNLVCPGTVQTESLKAFPDSESRASKCKESTPTGHLTTPEEVADLVAFLCASEAGRQIIGQTIVIDGGRSLFSY